MQRPLQGGQLLATGAGLAAIALAVAGGFASAGAALPAAALWWLAVALPSKHRARGGAVWILAISVLLHGALAATGFQSNDLHRYVWEGAVGLAGSSPYAVPPTDPSLDFLRAEFPAPIVHPDLPSIYPPLAQGSFMTAVSLGQGATGYRNAVLVLNLLLVGAVLLWRRGAEGGVGSAAIFAWSPVVVLGAVGGHLDVLMELALLGFVVAWERRRFAGAAALLGLAVLSKVVAVLLLPWAAWRQPRATLGVALPVIALGYAPYLADGSVLGSLSTFALDFRFNAVIQQWLVPVAGDATVLVAGLVLVGWVAVWTFREAPVAEATVAIVLGLLLLSPVVHYWYLGWFLVVLPGVRDGALRRFALAWAASIALVAPLYEAIAAGAPDPPDAALRVALELALPCLAVAWGLRGRTWRGLPRALPEAS